MPAQYSLDKKIVLRYLGAEVLLTGQVEKVEQLKKEIPNVYVLYQFTNTANPEAHFRGTGGELGRHKIQGLGPGFVPQNLEKSQINEIVMVTSEESMTNARRLAREEGLLVGISSGANLAACLKVAAREENKGKMIVTMFPSGGERYVSSELFALAREECTKMTF